MTKNIFKRVLPFLFLLISIPMFGQDETIITGQCEKVLVGWNNEIFFDFKGDFLDYGDGSWLLVGTAKIKTGTQVSPHRTNWNIEYDKEKDELIWNMGNLTFKEKNPYNSNLLKIKTDINSKPTTIILIKDKKINSKTWFAKNSYLTFRTTKEE